jgi:hypothetical protein
MKSVKLAVAMATAFLLVSAHAAQAAPHAQPKANSGSERVHAPAKSQPRAARPESKVRGNKRPVQHDGRLDYPQLG